MTVLLKDALAPNLVQTLEGNPAFVHGGPFANIAHGCNSVMATRTALKLGDYVVTEAGFGADLGAEKFFDIKCRKAGLAPAAAVIVATVRALKMHGGVGKAELGAENLAALRKGLANLDRHVAQRAPVRRAVGRGDQPVHTDTEAELALIASIAGASWGSRRWSASTGPQARPEPRRWRSMSCICADRRQLDGLGFTHLYPDEMPLWDKMRTIAREIYGAEDIIADQPVRDQFKDFQAKGFGHFPICVAKTQYSFSTDPDRKGAPSGHMVPIRELRLAGGAEFLVVVCGEIMTMPGLPRQPAAQRIRLDANGDIEGLF